MSFAKTYEQARASYKPLVRSSIKRGTKQMKRSRMKRHRVSAEETAWRECVLKRADYHCQWVDQQTGIRCQVRGKENLDAHHIYKRSQRPDLRRSIECGASLCRLHHSAIDTVEGRKQAIKAGLLKIETYEAAQKRKRETA